MPSWPRSKKYSILPWHMASITYSPIFDIPAWSRKIQRLILLGFTTSDMTIGLTHSLHARHSTAFHPRSLEKGINMQNHAFSLTRFSGLQSVFDSGSLHIQNWSCKIAFWSQNIRHQALKHVCNIIHSQMCLGIIYGPYLSVISLAPGHEAEGIF